MVGDDAVEMFAGLPCGVKVVDVVETLKNGEEDFSGYGEEH